MSVNVNYDEIINIKDEIYIRIHVNCWMHCGKELDWIMMPVYKKKYFGKSLF